MPEQTNADNAATRPLRRTDFRTPTQERASDLAAVKRLGQKFADMITAAAQGLAASPLRITLDQITESEMNAAEEGCAAFRLESGNGSIEFRIIPDRVTIFALCEIAFGGSGTEEAFSDQERPLSAIERGLRDAFSDSIADALAKMAAAEFGIAATISNVSGSNFTIDQQVIQIVFRYLVNIYGYSGELCLLANRDDLVAQLAQDDLAAGADNLNEQKRTAIRRRVAEADMEIVVSLPPEQMKVRDVVSLRPGKLFQLSSRLTSPLTVSSNGKDIFRAILDDESDKLTIKLVSSLQ